jgi:hypothetical protein
MIGGPGYSRAHVLLVLGLASAPFEMIATVAFVWAAIPLLIGVAVLVGTLRTSRT